MIELRKEVIIHVLFNVAHGKLFLSILTNLGYPGTTRPHIVFTHTFAGSIVELVNVILILDELVAPCPAIVAVVVVDVVEAV